MEMSRLYSYSIFYVMVAIALELHLSNFKASSHYDDYEPQEPEIDDVEPYEPEDPDDVENADGTGHTGNNPDHNSFENPDSRYEGRTVVNMGDDGSPMSVAKANAVQALREKKIPDNKRSTTPYMTKYEKARILGVRATQIR